MIHCKKTNTKKPKELNTCCTNVSWELYVYLFAVSKFEVFAVMIFRLESSLVLFFIYIPIMPSAIKWPCASSKWRRYISKVVLVLTLSLLVLLLMGAELIDLPSINAFTTLNTPWWKPNCFRKPLYAVRSLWVGACNSTTFLSRHFHRPIYFKIESTLNETPVGVP